MPFLGWVQVGGLGNARTSESVGRQLRGSCEAAAVPVQARSLGWRSGEEFEFGEVERHKMPSCYA